MALDTLSPTGGAWFPYGCHQPSRGSPLHTASAPPELYRPGCVAPMATAHHRWPQEQQTLPGGNLSSAGSVCSSADMEMLVLEHSTATLLAACESSSAASSASRASSGALAPSSCRSSRSSPLHGSFGSSSFGSAYSLQQQATRQAGSPTARSAVPAAAAAQPSSPQQQWQQYGTAGSPAASHASSGGAAAVSCPLPPLSLSPEAALEAIHAQLASLTMAEQQLAELLATGRQAAAAGSYAPARATPPAHHHGVTAMQLAAAPCSAPLPAPVCLPGSVMAHLPGGAGSPRATHHAMPARYGPPPAAEPGMAAYVLQHAQLQAQHQVCMGAVMAAARGSSRQLGSCLSGEARAKLQELMAVQQLQMELQEELLALLPVA